jgi:hypothetical protein
MVVMHVWKAMLEYGQLAWNKIVKDCTHSPLKAHIFLKKFDRSWLVHGIIGRRLQLRAHWN